MTKVSDTEERHILIGASKKDKAKANIQVFENDAWTLVKALPACE